LPGRTVHRRAVAPQWAAAFGPDEEVAVVVGCIDASSLSAGTISVNVTVTDVAGNSTDMTGTPATLVPCQNGQGQGGNQGE